MIGAGNKLGRGGWLSSYTRWWILSIIPDWQLPHRHSTCVCWLMCWARKWHKARAVAFPVTAAQLLSDANDDVLPHHHQNTKLCFYGRHLITDKKSSFLCPPSGTEMRLYASLQGDLVVFDGLTPDFVLMHLSFRQLARIFTNGLNKLETSSANYSPLWGSSSAPCQREERDRNNFISSHALSQQGYSNHLLALLQKHLLKPQQFIWDAAAHHVFSFQLNFFHAALPVVTWSSLHLGLTHPPLCSTTEDWPSYSLQDSSHSLLVPLLHIVAFLLFMKDIGGVVQMLCALF